MVSDRAAVETPAGETIVPPPRPSDRRSGIRNSVRTPPISTTWQPPRGLPVRHLPLPGLGSPERVDGGALRVVVPLRAATVYARRQATACMGYACLVLSSARAFP